MPDHDIEGELLQISSSYFCAGVELKNNVVARCAPIVRYMKGWPRHKVLSYCKKKEWAINLVGLD